MSDRLTIGQVAERSGLPVKTIRFYEEQGIVPPPERSSGGFRLYTPIDVRRLKLVRLAKLMGLGLPDIRALVSQAFASECADFADELLVRIAHQQAAIDARIGELQTLKRELVDLAQHVEHSRERLKPGQRVAGCDLCPILDVDLPVAEAVAQENGRGGNGQMVKDVVCGMDVSPHQAAGTSEYQGQAYYFCAPSCKQQFDANPARYSGQAVR